LLADAASEPTTDVDVPMTSDDIDTEAADEAEVGRLLALPAPVRRVRLLLMLPQSMGRLASVWNTFCQRVAPYKNLDRCSDLSIFSRRRKKIGELGTKHLKIMLKLDHSMGI
jgi:hypothetical protein